LKLTRRLSPENSINNILFDRKKLEAMAQFNTISQYKDYKELFEIISAGVTELDLAAIYEQVRYQGFNRHDYLKAALKVMSASTMIKVAMIGAVRGSNFKKIAETPSLPNDVKALMDSGVIINRKAEKTSDVTITRCTAALPEWSAYAMMIAKVPGRISGIDMNDCLQFPAAGSLPMNKKVRIAHIEFSSKFSRLIGGAFKATIYKAMYNDTVSISAIHPDLLPILGVRDDRDGVVDIDQLLKDYVDDDDIASEDEVALKGKRKRSRRV